MRDPIFVFDFGKDNWNQGLVPKRILAQRLGKGNLLSFVFSFGVNYQLVGKYWHQRFGPLNLRRYWH